MVVSFPDLLAKAYLAKTLTAFGKTFVRRSGTEDGAKRDFPFLFRTSGFLPIKCP